MSTPNKPVGVAVWGVGDHARRNTIPALAECAAVSLVGLHSRNTGVLEAEARRQDCLRWDSPETMLADPSVDAIYLATPVGLHHDQGRRILEAGKHLWCEKSLTTSSAHTRSLVQVAERYGRVLCEAFMYSHHPQFHALKAWLDAGAVGRVRSITGRFGFPHLAPDNIRYDPQLGGGALLDAGVYTLHMARLLAAQEPQRVHAELEQDEGYLVDTGGTALLHFADGLNAHLEWGMGRSYRNDLEIWGDAGTLYVERAFSKPPGLQTRLRLQRQDGSEEERLISAANHFTAMFEAFAWATREPQLAAKFGQDALAQAILTDRLRQDGPFGINTGNH